MRVIRPRPSDCKSVARGFSKTDRFNLEAFKESFVWVQIEVRHLDSECAN